MDRVLHNVAVGIFALVYGTIGLVIGAISGFVVLKLVEILGISGTSFVVARWVAAGWAVFLAMLAIAAYLRSSAGDRFSRREY